MVNPSTAQARVVVDELIRGGVRDVVLCPGSRNAPLAFALQDADRAGRIRLHVRIDERTAGYLAIGLAVAERRPGMRGDDVGHRGRQPRPGGGGGQLRAGAADRAVAPTGPTNCWAPAPTRRWSSSGYFGTQVRANISLGLAEEARPSDMDALNAQWRSATCRVLVAATGSRTANAGPVQFDIPLREPLVPDAEIWTPDVRTRRRAAPAASRGPTRRR